MTDEVIEIEDAQSDLVRIADLDKRDIVVFPLKIDKAKGDGETYEYLLCDVLVLSGPTTELMDTIPFVVSKMWLTSSPMIRNGQRLIDKANKVNDPHAKPFSGVVNSRKGQKGGRAYGIEAWEKDAPIRKLANAEAAKYIHARANVVEDADEFDE